MPYLEQSGASIEGSDIKALQAGEFFYCGKGQPIKIKTRKRKSKHSGKTLSVQSANIKRASRADAEAALKRLKRSSLTQVLFLLFHTASGEAVFLPRKPTYSQKSSSPRFLCRLGINIQVKICS